MEDTLIDLVLNCTEDTPIEDTVTDSQLFLFLQEVELAVKMEPGDVWGIYDSIDVSKYVFNQYITLNQVRTEIETYIANHCAHAEMFQWEVEPELIELEQNSIPVLHIIFTVEGGEEYGSVTSRFLVGKE